MMGTNDDEALRRRLDAGTQRTGKDLPCSAPPRHYGCSRTSDSGDEGRLTEFVAPQ
jgi:hypothetical protein